MQQMKSILLTFAVLCVVSVLGTNDDTQTQKVNAHRKNPGAHLPHKHSISVETPLKQEEAQTLFAKYHESYITKEAAHKLKHKLRSSKKRPITDEDYDDMVQGIIFKSKQKSMPHYQEKKYFDDLPSGEIHAEAEQDDVPQALHDKEEQKPVSVKGRKRLNHRRITRDTNEEGNKNSKRSAFIVRAPTFYIPNQQSGYYYQYQGQPAVQYRPVYFNIPQPPHNPITTKKPADVGTIGNRIGDDDEDDRPVWDIQQTPVRNSPGNSISETRPAFSTRRPSQTFTTRRPPPPLFHDSDTDEDDLQTINNQFNNNLFTTSAPPFNAQEQFTQRPPGAFIPSFTSRPQTPRPSVQTTSRQLSRCVWAIVNCCSRNTDAVRYSCFEAVGCHGAFWDLNPCSEELLDAAIDESESYFT